MSQAIIITTHDLMLYWMAASHMMQIPPETAAKQLKLFELGLGLDLSDATETISNLDGEVAVEKIHRAYEEFINENND